MSRPTRVAQLISVYKKDNTHEVTITFKLNIVHGILEQTMSFKQKKWPKGLAYYVNKPDLPPVFVDCDMTNVQSETEDVRDGYEEFTVVTGFDGIPQVIGYYDRPIEYSVVYHKGTGQVAYFPVLPSSYQILDARVKYYESIQSRKYRLGQLPAGRKLGTRKDDNTWKYLGSKLNKRLGKEKVTPTLFDRYIFKQIKKELTRRSEFWGYLAVQRFSVNIKLSECTDPTFLKSLVDEVWQQELSLDSTGIWNLLFLQSTLHDLLVDEKIASSSTGFFQKQSLYPEDDGDLETEITFRNARMIDLNDTAAVSAWVNSWDDDDC